MADLAKVQELLSALRASAQPSPRGPHRYATTSIDASRYPFDELCGPEGEAGWQQWDTESDAWYFGVWVDVTALEVLVYAEGDLSLSIYPTHEALAAAITRMEEFHGAPPPFAIVIDTDAKTRTAYTAKRLTGADVLALAPQQPTVEGDSP